jgi:hypothetical protein
VLGVGVVRIRIMNAIVKVGMENIILLWAIQVIL